MSSNVVPFNRGPYPPLPFEPEAEQAALGACLCDPSKIPEIQAVCNISDFHEPLHRAIAEAIFTIDRQRDSVTPLSVKAFLGQNDALSSVGGHAYLATLAEAGFEKDGVHCAGIVSITAARRAAMIAVWDASEDLAKGDRSLVEVLRPVVAASDRAAERDGARTGSSKAGETAYDFLRGLSEPDQKRGVTTGLAALDDILGALEPGNLYIVAGRPGMGKSAVGVSLASAAGKSNVSVEYFSLEMPRHQLSARLITDLDYDRRDGLYPLQYSRFLRRRASQSELERGAQAAARLEALPITIHDRDSMTMADIAGLARAKRARSGETGLVIIDHMHLIRPDDRYRGNQTQELGECAKEAKRLARALGWPVVLLAQLNRQVESRPEKERMPNLSDLRQSGEIEEAADVVMFLHRPAYYVDRRRPAKGAADPGWPQWMADMDPVRHDLNIDVAKHRNGETKPIRVFVDIGSNAIRDANDGS